MTDYSYPGAELELYAGARNWKAYWSSMVRPHLGDRVFDVGTGIGSNVELLHRKGAAWLCIEPDGPQLEMAADKLARLGIADTCKVVHGDLSAIPEDEKADSIIYIDVLEHIEDDHAELARAARLLKPGGNLIILSPAYAWLFSPFDEAVGHFRRYTKATLRAVVPPHLKQVQLRYLDSVGLLASAGNRLVLKASMPNKSQIAFWDRVLVPPSRLVDLLTGYTIGKTVLGVWRLPEV